MRFSNHWRKWVLLAVAVMFSTALPSSAVTVTYTDRALFNAAAAALGPILTEGYESYANDLQTGARTFALNSFSVSYDLAGDTSLIGVTDVINPDGGSGAGPTAGFKYLYANYPSSAVPTAAVGFIFGSPIRAFGSDFKDVEVATISYSASSGDAGLAVPISGNGVVQFFGIITDTPFSTITFSQSGGSFGDGVAFDQTSFVPEPSAIMLLLSVIPLCFSRGSSKARLSEN